jgi:hypothetical protein
VIWALIFLCSTVSLTAVHNGLKRMYLRDREQRLEREREQPHVNEQYAKTLASPM